MQNLNERQIKMHVVKADEAWNAAMDAATEAATVAETLHYLMRLHRDDLDSVQHTHLSFDGLHDLSVVNAGLDGLAKYSASKSWGVVCKIDELGVLRAKAA